MKEVGMRPIDWLAIWEWLNNLFDFIFFKSFLSELLATFIGAGLGISGALWLNRRQEMQRQKEEKLEDEKRKIKVISAIREELEFSYGELVEYKAHLENVDENNIDLITVRDETWNTFKEGGELKCIKDPILLNKFAETYFLIKEINFTSEKFFEMSGRETVNDGVLERQLGGLIIGIDKALKRIEILFTLI
jgi:hypothetical protein